MPNYLESPVTGSEVQRCAAIVITNTRNVTPTIRFDEENVLVVGDHVYHRSAGSIEFQFDPAETFDLLDTATGEPSGKTITAIDVYQALYSAYLHRAKARDAAGAVA